jgi:hypothetical protein
MIEAIFSTEKIALAQQHRGRNAGFVQRSDRSKIVFGERGAAVD